MDARDTTAINADLWASYLRMQWHAWLDPFGLNPTTDEVVRLVADGVAANIATAVSSVIAPPVARMYAENAPGVNAALADAAPPHDQDVIPPEYTRAAPDASQWEAFPFAAPPITVPVTAEDAVLAY